MQHEVVQIGLADFGIERVDAHREGYGLLGRPDVNAERLPVRPGSEGVDDFGAVPLGRQAGALSVKKLQVNADARRIAGAAGHEIKPVHLVGFDRNRRGLHLTACTPAVVNDPQAVFAVAGRLGNDSGHASVANLPLFSLAFKIAIWDFDSSCCGCQCASG